MLIPVHFSSTPLVAINTLYLDGTGCRQTDFTTPLSVLANDRHSYQPSEHRPARDPVWLILNQTLRHNALNGECEPLLVSFNTVHLQVIQASLLRLLPSSPLDLSALGSSSIRSSWCRQQRSCRLCAQAVGVHRGIVRSRRRAGWRTGRWARGRAAPVPIHRPRVSHRTVGWDRWTSWVLTIHRCLWSRRRSVGSRGLLLIGRRWRRLVALKVRHGGHVESWGHGGTRRQPRNGRERDTFIDIRFFCRRCICLRVRAVVGLSAPAFLVGSQ